MPPGSSSQGWSWRWGLLILKQLLQRLTGGRKWMKWKKWMKSYFSGFHQVSPVSWSFTNFSIFRFHQFHSFQQLHEVSWSFMFWASVKGISGIYLTWSAPKSMFCLGQFEWESWILGHTFVLRLLPLVFLETWHVTKEDFAKARDGTSLWVTCSAKVTTCHGYSSGPPSGKGKKPEGKKKQDFFFNFVTNFFLHKFFLQLLGYADLVRKGAWMHSSRWRYKGESSVGHAFFVQSRNVKTQTEMTRVPKLKFWSEVECEGLFVSEFPLDWRLWSPLQKEGRVATENSEELRVFAWFWWPSRKKSTFFVRVSLTNHKNPLFCYHF